MSLAESQELLYDICAKAETIESLESDPSRVLKAHFKSPKDQEFLAQYPAERFRVYRNHVSLGFLGGIADVFPVIRSLVSAAEWNELLNDFYLKRSTQSPLARRVFDEFSEYLQKIEGPLLDRLPFLHELAEYEQLELKLIFAKDVQLNTEWVTEAPSDPATLIPILNPHLELRIYEWPVHEITDKTADQAQKGRYPLIVYRHPESLKAVFIEGNELFADLIEMIRPGNLSIAEILAKLAIQHEIPEDKENAFVQEGLETLAQFRQKGIIIGMTQ